MWRLLFFVAGISAFIILPQNSSELHRVERAAPEKGYLRPCYFTNWAHYRPGRGKYLPEDYVPGLCTHILFAFGWMNEDFTARAYDEQDLPSDWAGRGMYQRINDLKKSDPNLKTLLSFGGWTFGTRLFKSMSSSSSNRKVFIDSSIALVRKWGFDGIDIDWEYPEAQDKQNYVSFIKELRGSCEEEQKSSGKDRLLVSAAVAAGKEKIDGGYDIQAVAPYFDFVLLMSYDFFGAWSSEIGFNSPLYARSTLPEAEKVLNVDWAARHWVERGLPKDKLIIGIPTYGRGWTMSDPSNPNPGTQGSPAQAGEFTREAGIAAYYEICEMLASGGQRHWQDEEKVPYVVKGNQWFGYDDKESITIKMNWLKQNGYGGAFVWDLDFDDFNGKCSNGGGEKYPLINVIVKELGGKTLPNPPSPATTQRPVGPTEPSVVTTTPKIVWSTPSGTKCESDGYYADPSDCAKFFQCANGMPYSFTCAPGTLFDSANNRCDWPSQAKCANGI